jgi:hypothetical protein
LLRRTVFFQSLALLEEQDVSVAPALTGILSLAETVVSMIAYLPPLIRDWRSRFPSTNTSLTQINTPIAILSLSLYARPFDADDGLKHEFSRSPRRLQCLLVTSSSVSFSQRC